MGLNVYQKKLTEVTLTMSPVQLIKITAFSKYLVNGDHHFKCVKCNTILLFKQAVLGEALH